MEDLQNNIQLIKQMTVKSYEFNYLNHTELVQKSYLKLLDNGGSITLHCFIYETVEDKENNVILQHLKIKVLGLKKLKIKDHKNMSYRYKITDKTVEVIEVKKQTKI